MNVDLFLQDHKGQFTITTYLTVSGSYTTQVTDDYGAFRGGYVSATEKAARENHAEQVKRAERKAGWRFAGKSSDGENGGAE